MPRVGAIGTRGVAGIFNGETMAGLRQRGKIGYSGGFGNLRCGHSKYGNNQYFGGVYQKRVTGYNRYGRNPNRARKVYYVRQKYYRPTDPKTPEQQSNRAKMAAAVAAWQELTENQKTVYNKAGINQARKGYNVFISEYLRKY